MGTAVAHGAAEVSGTFPGSAEIAPAGERAAVPPVMERRPRGWIRRAGSWWLRHWLEYAHELGGQGR